MAGGKIKIRGEYHEGKDSRILACIGVSFEEEEGLNHELQSNHRSKRRGGIYRALPSP